MKSTPDSFPADYLHRLTSLEAAYLSSDDPMRQSGYSGGPVRWRQERELILDAITGDGELLDVGCANGYLLECLLAWGKERGLSLIPYGLDLGPGLIELARQRLPHFADHFFVGNAWNWQPPHPFAYVYALYDIVPLDKLAECVHRLLTRMVAPNGRLILGAYGSHSRQIAPFEIGDFLQAAGFTLAGTSAGGDPLISRFTWLDANL